MNSPLSPAAVLVLEKRYLKRDAGGRVCETPDDMFRRVAANLAQVESAYSGDASRAEGEFYRITSSLEFLPNSPTLMNAGRRLQQLAACFVLPVYDSLDSIFKAVHDTALIHQSGGGTGFSFSRLRPSTDVVGSTGGAASGPISFMRVFNAATDAIKQGGARRGANMGVLRVDHPDIEEFIKVKLDPAEFNNFNLSVAVTDDFMAALSRKGRYKLINPRTGAAAGEKDAPAVFDLMVESAWATGEPGVLFIDEINRANPTPDAGEIEATNPCAEQPLLNNEACNLGSVNLARMLKKSGSRREIDFERLGLVIGAGVRFLDNAIDAGRYPTGAVNVTVKANRKIGLGVMGFADMLIAMRIRYGSPESFNTAETLMRFIRETAWEESARLAAERGAFPNFKGSRLDVPGAKPVRNATVTTIAPTGTLSILAGCSSGIEPLYALHYTRRLLDGEEVQETSRAFIEAAEEEGFASPELVDFVSKGGGIGSRKDVPEGIKGVFATAFDVTAEEHVRMQAAFQKYTDNAVSKTVNLPEGATPADVRAAFLLAHGLGCKGITVYRSGSRTEQVLTCRTSQHC